MHMVICVCHNVNERRIAECASEGVRSIKQLCSQTRAGTRCGKCLCEARRVLMDSVAREASRAAATTAYNAVA